MRELDMQEVDLVSGAGVLDTFLSGVGSALGGAMFGPVGAGLGAVAGAYADDAFNAVNERQVEQRAEFGHHPYSAGMI